MCALTGGEGIGKRPRKLIDLDVVDVELGRVDTAVSEQRFEGGDVSAALPQEPIPEAMPKLVRRQVADARATTHATNHPPERLLARRDLRILPPPYALVLRYPLLDLDRKHVIVELRPERLERMTEPLEHVRSERDRLPVLALPERAHAPAYEVHVAPAHAENLGPPQACAFHQQESGELVYLRGGAKPRELICARPVDVCLALLRAADLR